MASYYAGRFLTTLLTIPASEPPRSSNPPVGEFKGCDYGFMPNDLAGKWVWDWALGLVEFIPKGARKPPDNRPWHYSCLQLRDNYHKAALIRALKCEIERIKRLDLPTEVI